MRIVTVPPDPGRTYLDFRRQIERFVAETQAQGHDEAQLRGALNDALKSWRSQGYPKSWVFQARGDVLKALAPAPAREPFRPHLARRLVLSKLP